MSKMVKMHANVFIELIQAGAMAPLAMEAAETAIDYARAYERREELVLALKRAPEGSQEARKAQEDLQRATGERNLLCDLFRDQYDLAKRSANEVKS